MERSGIWNSRMWVKKRARKRAKRECSNQKRELCRGLPISRSS